MRDGEPSRTARNVAAYRLGFERLPAPFGDPDADDRLARDVAAGDQFKPDERIARYLRMRTAFFDRVVLNGLERGSTQVAVIGAGYDGRALRYAKPGVRWFEVDHPATQRDKRRRLARLAITTPEVAFVAADFVSDDVAAGLTGAGFEPDAPSLLLCEGVAVYLEPAVLVGLLEQLRSIATAGTRLAMSAGIPGAHPARREQFAARLAGLGEPAALAGADVETLLTTARWRAAELSERAQRAGMLVGVPVWEPGAAPTAARVGNTWSARFTAPESTRYPSISAAATASRSPASAGWTWGSCASTVRTGPARAGPDLFGRASARRYSRRRRDPALPRRRRVPGRAARRPEGGL